MDNSGDGKSGLEKLHAAREDESRKRDTIVHQYQAPGVPEAKSKVHLQPEQKDVRAAVVGQLTENLNNVPDHKRPGIARRLLERMGKFRGNG